MAGVSTLIICTLTLLECPQNALITFFANSCELNRALFYWFLFH
uniref:Uncharacterized protein n=1 Tax=Anguilla anguilla TaxID=7936 RepID=A0A0E9QWB4_ANGAN